MEKPVNNTNKRKLFILLLCVALLIRLLAANKNIVETFYSTAVYRYLASAFRWILGWVPFSVGDFLYLLLILYFLWKLISIPKFIRSKNKGAVLKANYLFSLLNKILLLYIVFNVCWGLNYDRKGIRSQMGIAQEEYSKEDLLQVNELLLDKVNRCKDASLRQNIVYATPTEVFRKTHTVYEEASHSFPYLQYKNKSIKSSFFGTVGNYLGFSGYYNPFTGEAQVNTTIPSFLQPYVSCHEVAHQLGYAKENEANFVGYIAATASNDSMFMYSAYLDLFLYANKNLRRTDSVSAKQFSALLNPEVKKDIQLVNEFYRKFQNPVEPYINWLYGKYLQSNQQPSGMLSYSEVVGDLIAYYKKYGRIGGK